MIISAVTAKIWYIKMCGFYWATLYIHWQLSNLPTLSLSTIVIYVVLCLVQSQDFTHCVGSGSVVQ